MEIMNGWRTSKMKRFVVNRIVAPFGPPIEERPPVPTLEEREAERESWRAFKKQRNKLRKHTDDLEKKIANAKKTTDDITKLAWKMNIIERVN